MTLIQSLLSKVGFWAKCLELFVLYSSILFRDWHTSADWLALTVYTLFALLVDVTWSVSSFHFGSKLQAIPPWTKIEQKIIDYWLIPRHSSGSKSRADFKLWQCVPHKTKTSFGHFESVNIKIAYYKKYSAKIR